MVYRANGMVLNSIRDVLVTPMNDVVICQDLASSARVYYTLLVIKDRACAKRMVLLFEETERRSPDGERSYLFCFTQNELLCYAFAYRPERQLEHFAPSQMDSVQKREAAAINLVMECLSSPLPYPLLYLVLTQGNVHIEKDNTIYFTPYVDLSGLDESCGEAACVNTCISTILQLLEGSSRRKLKSLALLRKKQDKNAYRSFPELYRDIKLTSLPTEKQRLIPRLKGWWRRNKDTLFHILLVVSVIVVILALLILLCMLIFGDMALFRLFEHSFDVIGTENLNP